MRLPFSTPFEMETSLDAKRVFERLQAAVTAPRILSRTRAEVTGVVRSDGFVLKGPLPIGMRNNFRRVLDVQFMDSPDGTWLRGRFRLSWPVFYFMCFWIGTLVIAAPANLIAVLTRSGFSTVAREPDWFIQFGLILFGFFLVQTGVWMSRGSEEKVREFLQDLLNRDEVVRESAHSIY